MEQQVLERVAAEVQKANAEPRRAKVFMRKNRMKNKPCPCKSGKKFKKCCWELYSPAKVLALIERNLCDSCLYRDILPECMVNGEFQFGPKATDDNVCFCDGYTENKP